MNRLIGLLVIATLAFTCTVQADVEVDLTSYEIDSAQRVDRNSPHTIQWRSVESQIEGESSLSFLYYDREATSSTRSQLLTFPPQVTVQQVIAPSSKLIRALFSHPSPSILIQCNLLEGTDFLDVESSDSEKMSQLLQQHVLTNGENSLKLSCSMSPKVVLHNKKHTPSVRASSVITRVFSFVQFVPQITRPNEVKARNMIRRAVTGEVQQYPLEAAELAGDSFAGLVGWASAFLKYHWGALPDYLNYTTSATQTGRWHLNTGAVLQPGSTFGDESDGEIRIAAAADWAAGTIESDYVQQVMMNGNSTAYNPHWTLHVGDVYYVGAPEYVNSNCLGVAPPGVSKGVKWPSGSIGSLAVMGNHEMYARALGFFENFLPTLGVIDTATGKATGQDAGYASLENKYWRVIMLDTGFNTYSLIPGKDNKNNTQPQAIMDWLVDSVDISNPTDTRGIIFFSHHQVESAFGGGEPSQATMDQIAAVLPANRTVVWLFGHEHRVSFYKLKTIGTQNSVGVFSRCFGNGGFPSNMADIPARANSSGLIAYDDRLYELLTGFFPLKVTYNGFIHMTLNQATASITYSSLATDPTTGKLSPTLQTDLVNELFVVDQEGNTQLTDFAILDKDITVVQ